MISEGYRQTPDSLFSEPHHQSQTLFRLDNVRVSYRDFDALRDVNLQIRSGEIIFLTGASGAGKTTLLNVLAGNIRPSSGKIQSSNNQFVAQVFQDLKLIERLTCRENLQFAFDPSIYKNKKEFDSDLEELAKIMGISNRLDSKLSEANGGLKQKISIVRALLTRPSVFLADEPTSSLDYENAKRFFDLLNIYNVKRKMTVVWASHNRELVQKFSGRIIHLDKGRLIHSGHACFI
ncbi:ABC transporter ATP-binding protein [Bacteriovorax sp. Seq25_V]|uniref:ABC transporter ATP-binding protein n=1 Tax=Bacteriovorax sp. Seq25_V TaxID=1201288 RepID=UPI00038A5328|nr:ABC transporter ATP-binding protein [Bacteriovorax sp. Seq25_V]EQC45343.1 ABC transporter, ATP-binding protein [Bacteriovorax sp. Seq25_V]